MIKIAIQGHLIRGKEVIQILESLGGKNINDLFGTAKSYGHYYYINNCNIIAISQKHNLHNYKFYTLEEFKKAFPFKVGDKVRDASDNEIGTITNLIYINNKLFYNIDFVNSGQAFMLTKQLKLYKEMKEERNIILTLEKANEWYNKGGELKEIALQAYSEEELTKAELPKTWEEYCIKYPKQQYETYIGIFSTIESYNKISNRHPIQDKNVCRSEKSAAAHLALIQLEQLRDCYRQGDIPDFTKSISKYCIAKINKRIDVVKSSYISYFLSFTKKEIAEKFLTNFKPLIKIAEDYI